MHNIKKYLIIVSFLAVLAAPSFASAITVADLQAQINTLLAQVQVLQVQLAQLQGQPAVWCYDFNRDLKFGNRGTDIYNLQLALEKEGFSISQSEKDQKNFSESTADAVVGFQQKYKDEILTPLGLKYGTGYVGEKTRAKLNALYGCGITPIPVPTLSLSASPLSVSLGQNTILTWTSSGVSSCTAFGGFWDGTKSLSGSETVSPTTTSVYILTCSGVNGSVSSSITVNIASSTNNITTGTVVHQATLDDQPWSGSLTYQCSSADGVLVGPVQTSDLPLTANNRPTGARVCSYVSGGPSGAIFNGITPSANQTLTSGGTITFTYNFSSSSSEISADALAKIASLCHQWRRGSVTITSLSPSFGSVGSFINIAGTGFIQPHGTTANGRVIYDNKVTTIFYALDGWSTIIRSGKGKVNDEGNLIERVSIPSVVYPCCTTYGCGGRPVTPGKYYITVEKGDGQSNLLEFTVTK